MDTLFTEYLDGLVDSFVDPKKRVFLGYLGSALVIALGIQLVFVGGGLGAALAKLFSRSIWWSASSKADYKMVLLNQAVMMGLAPRLLANLTVATLLFESLHIWFDGRVMVWPEAPGWAIAAAFTTVLFLLDDGSKYLLHRWLHRWPLLWCFHKVHHTAESLTPLTVFRTHPVEAVLFSLRATLVQAVATAVFLYLFGERAELVTVLGANVFLFLFHATGSNLRHSHAWISYGPVLEKLLISPAQHQIHHSAEVRHHDRNFGVVLALWDWMGGSLCLAERNQTLRFGVGDPDPQAHTLGALYLEPFREAANNLVSTLTKGLSRCRP